jgi:hypothetical protein
MKAHKVLEENELKWVALPDEKEMERFQEAGVVARKNLAGKYFSTELLDQVLKFLREFREARGNVQ